MMASNPLAQLRDIHYPEPISIWPLAIGWYLLIAIACCLVALASYYAWQFHKKNRLKKIVLQRIDKLREQQTHHETIADELSMLLKRAALASYPREQVAGLCGEPWLKFLDKTAKTDAFSKGPGRLLIVSPYCKKSESLPDPLFELIKNWVKNNL